MKRTELKRKTELKRNTPLRSHAARPKRKPASACAWPARCTNTVLPIRVSDDERYCRTHGTKAADWLCGLVVKLRDRCCLECGTTVDLEWAHIVSRGARYIRYSPDNSVTLCRAHHFRFTKAPAAWGTWVERRWPGRLSRLHQLEAAHEDRGGSVDYATEIRLARAVLGHRDWRPFMVGIVQARHLPAVVAGPGVTIADDDEGGTP